MTKILFIAPGASPIPVTKGGAVESLIEYVAMQNEISKKLDLIILSPFEENAFLRSKKYKSTKFIYFKVTLIINIIDKIIYFIAKYIFRKKKVLSYRYICQRFAFVRYARKILKKESFDKVIMENHVILLFVFNKKKLLKRYLGKFYYHEHNILRNDLGRYNIVMNCKKIITVSNYIKNDFLTRYPNYPENQVAVLRNVADLDRFGHFDKDFKTNFFQKNGIPITNRIIMFAGRLDAAKGALELLKAFNMLEIENVTLVIVGAYCYAHNMSDGFDQELRKEASLKKDKIIFTGFIDFNSMPNIYSISDIMVLPSIWDDPAPLSIIEALCCGTALITTKSGGIPEYAFGCSIILERDENLVLNIKKNIEELLKNQNKIKDLREKAFKMTRNWTIEKFYNDLIEIIKD